MESEPQHPMSQNHNNGLKHVFQGVNVWQELSSMFMYSMNWAIKLFPICNSGLEQNGRIHTTAVSNDEWRLKW